MDKNTLKKMKNIPEDELNKMLAEYEQKKQSEIPQKPADETPPVKPAKHLKLNLACGQTRTPVINNVPQEGYTGVDKTKTDAVDIVHDLETYPWPFEDGSVDEVFCSHFIEHVKDLMPFMDELWRVMKQGAKATIIAPYYTSVRAMQDPTHIRPISEWTFQYFNKGWREVNKLNHYPIKSDFDFAYSYQMDQEWATRADEARNFAVKHYFNVVADIYVTLTKR